MVFCGVSKLSMRLPRLMLIVVFINKRAIDPILTFPLEEIRGRDKYMLCSIGER